MISEAWWLPVALDFLKKSYFDLWSLSLHPLCVKRANNRSSFAVIHFDWIQGERMNVTHTRFLAIALLSGSLLATGCKSAAPTPAAVKNADGTVTNPNGSVTVPGQAPPQQMAIRNTDGSITNPDGSVTYPPGSRVANRENGANGAIGNGPARSGDSDHDGDRNVAAGNAALAGNGGNRGVDQQQAPPQVRRSIPAGTPVTVRLNGGLAASRSQIGDRWTGTLERPLMSAGQTVFPSGTPVSGQVVASQGRGRFRGAGDLGIELTAIGRNQVRSSEYEQIAKGRGKRTAVFAGGGAGLGAIIGGLAGGGKGALIGGLSGAGAGTAAGAYTGQRDVIIPSESVITFRLADSLRM